ncbi:MAG: peptidylprolyl isomerase [Minisyncoccales bacterium]
MNKLYILLILIILISGSYFLFTPDTGKEEAASDNDNIKTLPETNMTATMQTNFGEIKLELFSSDAPKTVENFVKLSKDGFYNGLKFHRVIKGFMIQGGDPLSKDNSFKDRWGTGGPGYTFADEIHLNNHNIIGTISMANAGPDTNGSQFFINTDNNNFLDAKHTVFGKIIEGIDIVGKIENVATDGRDCPIDNVIIESINIADN